MKIISGKELPKSFFAYKDEDASEAVSEILEDVKRSGDEAVRKYTSWFDGVDLKDFVCNAATIKAAYDQVSNASVDAIQKAAENIRKFAKVQRNSYNDFEVELTSGVRTGQRITPIERVAVYAPGGRFPLVSSVLMGAIPARVAGVKELVICSPPGSDGNIHPAILVAADIVGADEVYRIGGAQAIAALAYGTETIRGVDKIVGPGNKYVAEAKKAVYGIVGIDLIAGPTEVLVIADDSANPEILAADLLAQAEHDVDASAILVTPSRQLADAVKNAVEAQLAKLKNRETAAASIATNGVVVLVDNLAEAVAIANRKAPEHLEVQVENPADISDDLKNFGAMFIGEMSAEVLGDYSSGINHTLPTNGTARYRGGLGVHDFLKIQSTLQVTEEGFAEIAPIAEMMAETEGLGAHGKAVTARKKFLK